MTNWLAEVKERQEELLTDLYRLLKIPSVRDDEKATAEAPVGPGPLAALEEFLEMAREDGFKTKQYGPWAGHIEFGQGEELMGILGHVDVVPVGTGWKTNPFDAVIQDDRIYARGASDNKGPLVGAYNALKLLKDKGFEPSKRIRLIIGTDEESEWQCMKHYFAEAEMPDFGFSPDANFPVINGEKGNVTVELNISTTQHGSGTAHLKTFEAGLRVNMVPQEAQAEIEWQGDDSKIKEAYHQYLEDWGLSGEVIDTARGYLFQLTGKAAHGALPHLGANAGTFLAAFLYQNFTFDQLSATAFVEVLGTKLHLTTDGHKVGLNIGHEVMGDLTLNVGVVSYDEEVQQILLNIRYPEGATNEWMEEQLANALEGYPLDIHWRQDSGMIPHYVPEDDPLVKTLLGVYAEQTGLEAYGVSIGGGTYARVMPRGVAFGALFPGSEDTMHQANEYISMDDLLRATAIYAQSIYELTK